MAARPSSRTRAILPPAGEGPLHLAAAAGIVGTGVLALLLVIFLLGRVAADPARTGPVLAFFPPSWSKEAALIAAARADGLVRAEGWLPGMLALQGDTPGLRARLVREGAIFVMAPFPFDLATLGSCIGLVRGDGPRRTPVI